MQRYFDRALGQALPGPVSRQAVYARLVWPAEPDLPPGRPYTVINMVRTVDGKAVIGGSGTTDLIGSDTDHRLMARIEAQVDAVLWGASTIREDDPPYPLLDEAARQQRLARGLRPALLWVVISASGAFARVPRAFRGGRANTVLFTSERSEPARRDALAAHTRVIALPAQPAQPAGAAERGGWLDIRQILRLLRETFGVRSLNCLGGPHLNGLLIEAGTADELFLTLAPKLHGGRGLPGVVEYPQASAPRREPAGDLAQDRWPHLELLSLYGEGDEMYLRYRLVDHSPVP